MADNRMFLFHVPTGRKILLAKYFPSAGWRIYKTGEELNAWLFDTQEDCDLTESERGYSRQTGDTRFRLVFDVEPEGPADE